MAVCLLLSSEHLTFFSGAHEELCESLHQAHVGLSSQRCHCALWVWQAKASDRHRTQDTAQALVALMHVALSYARRTFGQRVHLFFSFWRTRGVPR